LGQLQALLDDSKARETASDVQMQSLGQDLNAALARVAAEEAPDPRWASLADLDLG
jgi:chemotaxis protein MotB